MQRCQDWVPRHENFQVILLQHSLKFYIFSVQPIFGIVYAIFRCVFFFMKMYSHVCSNATCMYIMCIIYLTFTESFICYFQPILGIVYAIFRCVFSWKFILMSAVMPHLHRVHYLIHINWKFIYFQFSPFWGLLNAIFRWFFFHVDLSCVCSIMPHVHHVARKKGWISVLPT